MPTIPNPRVPQWLDPEQASVTEDPLTQVLRQYLAPAIRTVYGDPADPNTAMQTAMPNALVTLFKDKAAREAATALYRSGMKRAGPIMERTATEFADRYPRIAAHIKPVLRKKDVIYPMPEGGEFRPAASISVPEPFVVAQAGGTPTELPRTLLNLYPEGRQVALPKARFMTSHEGTHTAQALGNKNFMELYQLANKLMGYGRNPFEDSANRTGRAAVEQMPTAPFTTAIRQLEDSARMYLGTPGEKGDLAQQILDVLQQRRTGTR